MTHCSLCPNHNSTDDAHNVDPIGSNVSLNLNQSNTAVSVKSNDTLYTPYAWLLVTQTSAEGQLTWKLQCNDCEEYAKEGPLSWPASYLASLLVRSLCLGSQTDANMNSPLLLFQMSIEKDYFIGYPVTLTTEDVSRLKRFHLCLVMRPSLVADQGMNVASMEQWLLTLTTHLLWAERFNNGWLSRHLQQNETLLQSYLLRILSTRESFMAPELVTDLRLPLLLLRPISIREWPCQYAIRWLHKERLWWLELFLPLVQLLQEQSDEMDWTIENLFDLAPHADWFSFIAHGLTLEALFICPILTRETVCIVKNKEELDPLLAVLSFGMKGVGEHLDQERFQSLLPHIERAVFESKIIPLVSINEKGELDSHGAFHQLFHLL